MSAALYQGGASVRTNAARDCEAKTGGEGDGTWLIVSTGYNTGTTQSRERCAPLHQSGTVLQCFSGMRRPDIGYFRQVGDRAGELLVRRAQAAVRSSRAWPRPVIDYSGQS